jgi:hypothetical protein
MHKRIAAFISIPKNASKSVLKMLDIGPNRDREATSSPVIYENHQRGVVLSRHHDLQNLFVFCFSRNPFDRCISWYEFHRHIAPYKDLTFDKWIREGMPHHFRVQNATNYLEEGISPLLQANYTRNTKIDFIGRFERLEHDLRYAIHKLNQRAQEINLQKTFEFTNVHINQSNRLPRMSDYYCPETEQIVLRLLAEDFDLFNYPKRLTEDAS